MKFEMIHYDSHVFQPYRALSHLWSEPEFSKEVIINSRTLTITIVPDVALRNIWTSARVSKHFLWVDGICMEY